ncbi:hypothetical protein CRG98_047431 [Punica granatum]|uniref:Uncharacterized protein n=1 Tax=Punica granatum TaxID=22663 RepID=A0A2I0HKR0_PUNGR|nr:hypothetical protein CRG98_047431 [Punica granatum]
MSKNTGSSNTVTPGEYKMYLDLPACTCDTGAQIAAQKDKEKMMDGSDQRWALSWAAQSAPHSKSWIGRRRGTGKDKKPLKILEWEKLSKDEQII